MFCATGAMQAQKKCETIPVSYSRRGALSALSLAATISVMKVDPVHAAFGEPDAEVYLSESKELLKAFVLMGDRQAVDMKAYTAEADNFLNAYKRQHKGHAESYNALYSMASMVRFNKGTPLDEEQREKMTRLVAEAAQGLREEYGA
mmetsp:Transcript_1131/g.2065  ORF Transcript_1131/g.2065 Transcript_1131/m.2065 type:complete len:147 (-) Transcript_1131:287-727(-)